jgi:FMN phosphatase YigB (HAD superfamily)
LGYATLDSPALTDHPAKNSALRALLIDFAGTLFLPLDGKQWLTAAVREARVSFSAQDHSRLAGLLDISFGRVQVPGRDLSPIAHRRSMLPALESLVGNGTLATALYDLQLTGEFWHLRSGARELVCRARKKELRIIVVSNVAWDIRPLFAGVGLLDQIHGFALSYEVGAEKPDKLIFERALDMACCAPSEALFIGDGPGTDSGALDLGMPVILVPRISNNTDRSLFMIADWLIGAN